MTYIKCVNTSQSANGHFTSKPLDLNGNMNISFLKQLFKQEIQAKVEECGAIEGRIATSKFLP